VKELIKAALAHNGIAVLDIISPCVTFHNQDDSMHSYTWGKQNEKQLHDISFIPARDEITVEDFEEGTSREVELHDGSTIVLKKLDKDYDPTNRWEAMHMLEEAHKNNWLMTGLIYVEPDAPSMFEAYSLPETPLNRTPVEKLRPGRDMLDQVNNALY